MPLEHIRTIKSSVAVLVYKPQLAAVSLVVDITLRAYRSDRVHPLECPPTPLLHHGSHCPWSLSDHCALLFSTSATLRGFLHAALVLVVVTRNGVICTGNRIDTDRGHDMWTHHHSGHLNKVTAVFHATQLFGT